MKRYCAALVLLASCLLCNVKAGPHETHAPYSILKANKTAFHKIDKKHLGLACSVYFKGGRPKSITALGPADPKGMVKQLGNIRIVNGELYAIGKRHLTVAWFYDETDQSSSRHHYISADDIDYVAFEKDDGYPSKRRLTARQMGDVRPEE